MGDDTLKLTILVPARGESKNVMPVNGIPLVKYALAVADRITSAGEVSYGTIHGIEGEAATATTTESNIKAFCSTNDLTIIPMIKKYSYVALDHRPPMYCQGDRGVHNWVADYFLPRYGTPDYLALIQPTNPFVSVGVFEKALLAISSGRRDVASVQTVHQVPHIYHAWNQRRRLGGRANRTVEWVFPKVGKTSWGKEGKPEYYAFSNLVIVKPDALIEQKTFFAEPSIPLVVSRAESLDIDTLEDVAVAETYIREKLVEVYI